MNQPLASMMVPTVSEVVEKIAACLSVNLPEAPNDHGSFMFDLRAIEMTPPLAADLYVEPGYQGVLLILAMQTSHLSPQQKLEVLTVNDVAQGAPCALMMTFSMEDDRLLVMVTFTEETKPLEEVLMTLFEFVRRLDL